MDKKKLLIIIISVVAVLAIAGTALGLGLSLGGESSSSSSSSSESSSENSSYFDPSFTVSFESNGGTVFEAVEVDNGSYIDLGAYLPEKEDGYFYGWCEDPSFMVRADRNYYPTSDITLYAEWGVEEKFKIVFYTGAGSRIDDAYYATYEYIAPPTDPTRSGYVFGGWFQDEECTREFVFFGNTMPRKNLRIYAKWIQAFTIKFVTNGGTAIDEINGLAGEEYDIPANPTKQNSIFEGWYSDSNLQNKVTLNGVINGNATYYAKWRQPVSNIKVNLNVNNSVVSFATDVVTLNEGDTLSVDDIVTKYFNAIADYYKPYIYDQTIDAREKPVYKFNGWAYDRQGVNAFEGKIPAVSGAQPSITLYATWARSSSYCMVSFLGDTTETYYVEKGKTIDITAKDNANKAEASANGWVADGFYTADGQFLKDNQKVNSDMELMPYFYSEDLVMTYDETRKGYAVNGYDANSDVATMATPSLSLYLPEYYNDGTHGTFPVKWINDNAFDGYNVTEVHLSSYLTGIGKQAFANTKITSIVLPATVKEIHDEAFKSSMLEGDAFNCLGKLTWLGADVFNGTPYVSTLASENGFVYFDSAKTIVYDYTGNSNSIVIPTTVTMVASKAFAGVNVNTLTISDGVVTICDNAFENASIKTVNVGNTLRTLGNKAFYNNTALETVTFKVNRNFNVVSEYAFYGCTSLANIDLSPLSNLETVGDYAFYGCTSLEEVIFPLGMTTNSGLLSFFNEIGDHAFDGCSVLEEVEIPYSTTRIGDYGFANTALNNMPTAVFLTEIGEYSFANCANIKGVDLRGERLIEEDYWDDDVWVEVYSRVPVIKISKGAFSGCTGLEYFFLSFEATAVEDLAFENCTSLKRVVVFGELIDDEPVSFSETAFEGVALNSLVIYVQDGKPEYSATSKWQATSGGMKSYVEIYTEVFTGTVYEDVILKEVDEKAPLITLNKEVVEPNAGATLTAFDVLAFINSIDVVKVSDNVSAPEDCVISISKVERVDDRGNGVVEITENNGKYDISEAGRYGVTVKVTDEYGTSDEIVLYILVK